VLALSTDKAPTSEIGMSCPEADKAIIFSAAGSDAPSSSQKAREQGCELPRISVLITVRV